MINYQRPRTFTGDGLAKSFVVVLVLLAVCSCGYAVFMMHRQQIVFRVQEAEQARISAFIDKNIDNMTVSSIDDAWSILDKISPSDMEKMFSKTTRKDFYGDNELNQFLTK